MTGKLDDHQLHAQAETQIRHFILARITNRLYFSLNTATTKPTWNQHSIGVAYQIPAFAFFQLHRMNPCNIYIYTQGKGSMMEGFAYAHIGIMQFYILSYQGNVDLGLFAPDLRYQAFPGCPVGGTAGFQPQARQHVIPQAQFF